MLVSSCLLGEKVRYDATHAHHDLINHELARLFELISLCPETGIGLGVPRPPVQLVKQHGRIYVRGVADPALDITPALQEYANRQRDLLASVNGGIFKSRSPSCGIANARLLTGETLTQDGTGLFVTSIMQHFPDLPVCNETTLDNPLHCQQFIARVFTHAASHPF